MCCGRPSSTHTTPPRSATPARSVRQPLVVEIAFEYTGATGMTVRGPVSGLGYRFERPGSRVSIDPRDAPALVGVPRLRRV